ncbi:MAG TPA: zf-HC2 domain-containing protein [Steroidobacteraceae bacterium]|nr:zf-HC2 domain-containing protein [Steroidobacteraceae bacterium]
MLPWLANGRLSGPERTRIEEHVRECAQCAQEVALQR